MTAFRPGQSPPPVSNPIRIGRQSYAVRDQNHRVPGNPWIWGAAAIAVATLGAGVAAQRRFKRRIAEDPEEAFLSEPPRGRPLEVRSSDGTLLHAELFGPEQGLTVVLAHGWTESLQYWIYQIHELTERGI